MIIVIDIYIYLFFARKKLLLLFDLPNTNYFLSWPYQTNSSKAILKNSNWSKSYWSKSTCRHKIKAAYVSGGLHLNSINQQIINEYYSKHLLCCAHHRANLGVHWVRDAHHPTYYPNLVPVLKRYHRCWYWFYSPK